MAATGDDSDAGIAEPDQTELARDIFGNIVNTRDKVP